MAAVRTCRVVATGLDGIRHSVDVQASSLFEAAATALGLFRQQGWATDALTPTTVLRVEVLTPSIVHEVPLKALDQWIRSPSASPRESMAKQKAGTAAAK